MIPLARHRRAPPPAVLLFADTLLDVEHVSTLLAALAIVCRVSTRNCVPLPSPRIEGAAIVVPRDDPMTAVVSLRTAGLDLPMVLLSDQLTTTAHQGLRAQGTVVWRPRSLSSSALHSALAEVTEGASTATPRAEEGLWLDGTLLRAGHGNRSVRLTRPEFALLEAFASSPNRPLSVAELGAYAWGDDLPARGAAQVVTVRIHHLRQKLARIAVRDVIRTVRSVGYVYRPARTEAMEA